VWHTNAPAQSATHSPISSHIHSRIHGSAPTYLSRLVRVADLPGRRSLHSARSSRLLVPSIRLSTVGGRAFPVAGLSIWNNLPDTVTSAPTLCTFYQRLITYLFSLSSLSLSLGFHQGPVNQH